MFEITGDDIADLNDEDLRTLVGRLCEAEVRRIGHAVTHVTWGGNQTAKDGGLDVRVDLPSGPAFSGVIPAASTGLQVKKPDMPAAEITEEMKPKGILRQVIVDLAKANGAYIIISSSGSTSDSALKKRREAMRDALKGLAEADRLKTDFYDRGRIASWVREHPGLIPWIRAAIGKSITGWRSFGSWSRAPNGVDPSFLFDDGVRLKTREAGDEDGLSVVGAIERIREKLGEPGNVVRLVGLSGVGKTRLCEALFEEAIGTSALDSTLAIYADVGEFPDPPPMALATDLIADGRRAILVIDNCPNDLHRRLSELVRSSGSLLSVITVEYDIRDDQPEGTEVFSLEASSPALIEKLVRRRYPNVSQVDAGTIAEFSGGNARVALALASTVGKSESLSGLSDNDLFGRLFRQRNADNSDLLAIAQVCALVYSFDGENIGGADAELSVLADLAGKTVDEVFKEIAELKRRDLMQERGPWRAVLPHAIANKLAAGALQDIPAEKVDRLLVTGASARLRRSFSRRIGYLDKSREARKLVEAWLAPGGLLADLAGLDEEKRGILTNVAPVAPDLSIEAIERALDQADEATLRKSVFLVRLLRSLAFDPALFDRCIELMLRFAKLDESDSPLGGEPKSALVSLFYIVLSGTHAPIAMRRKFLERLLTSKDTTERLLGLQVLDAMLTTEHFTSTFNHDFGARSRDYGSYPQSHAEVRAWYDGVMSVATSVALSGGQIAEATSDHVARNWRGLWMTGQMDVLERLGQEKAKGDFWRAGWIAVRETKRFEGREMLPELLRRLEALEDLLRPKNLVSQVRGIVLSSDGRLELDEFEVDDEEAFATQMKRFEDTVVMLGKDVAGDATAFLALVPNLFGGGSNYVGLFGHGLGQATGSPDDVWKQLKRGLSESERRDSRVLRGFLSGLNMQRAALVQEFLDQAVDDPVLAPVFPDLQAGVDLGEKGLARIMRALQTGKTPAKAFIVLAYGRTTDTLSGPAFRDLVLAISDRAEGFDVAIEIMAMRLFADAQDKRLIPAEIAEAGRALLDRFEFKKRSGGADREDRELRRIAEASLTGKDGEEIACKVARRMMDAISRYDVFAHSQDDLTAGLLKTQPIAVLDELFGGDEKARRRTVRAFVDLGRSNKSPLDVVPDGVLIEWCDRDPAVRYPLIAASASLFKRPRENEDHEWKPLAARLLQGAPDKRGVLAEIVHGLRPRSWSGSLAAKLESRLKLLERLPIEDAPGVELPHEAAKAALRQEIEAERRNEAAESEGRESRFE